MQKIVILFVNGMNDFAYPLDSYMHSFDAVPNGVLAVEDGSAGMRRPDDDGLLRGSGSVGQVEAARIFAVRQREGPDR